MVDAVLHVGAQKTASTTLQTHFYPKLEGVFYLGRFASENNPDHFLTDELGPIFHEINYRNMGLETDLVSVREHINQQYELNKSGVVLL